MVWEKGIKSTNNLNIMAAITNADVATTPFGGLLT